MSGFSAGVVAAAGAAAGACVGEVAGVWAGAAGVAAGSAGLADWARTGRLEEHSASAPAKRYAGNNERILGTDAQPEGIWDRCTDKFVAFATSPDKRHPLEN